MGLSEENAKRIREHLDALRYDTPKEAALNAEAVAVRLVPPIQFLS